MGLFDGAMGFMQGYQPNQALGADIQAMPDPRRQALLRGLGIQPTDAGYGVTGNWMQSLGQPPAPPGPTPPAAQGNPSPAQAAVAPPPPANSNPPFSPGSAAPSIPPPQSSAPARGQMPAGTAANSAAPNAFAGAPQPSPMVAAPGGGQIPQSSPIAQVAGNSGPMLPGIGAPPPAPATNMGTGAAAGAAAQMPGFMSQPGGTPAVPQGLPAFMQTPQGQQGNLGPMNPDLAGGPQPAFLRPTASSQFLSNPGQLPAQLQQIFTNPQTGGLQSLQAFTNQQAGINPTVGMNGMIPDFMLPSAEMYQRGARSAAESHAAMVAAMTQAEQGATQRAHSMGTLGLETTRALGANGVPGSMATNASEAATRASIAQDAISKDANAARTVAQIRLAHAQQGINNPDSYYQDIYNQLRQMPTDQHVPFLANQFLGQRPGATAPAPAAAPANPQQAQAEAMRRGNPILSGIWNELTNQITPRQGTQTRLPAETDAGGINQLLANFVSRASGAPGITAPDVQQFLGQHSGLGEQNLRNWANTSVPTLNLPWNRNDTAEHQARRWLIEGLRNAGQPIGQSTVVRPFPFMPEVPGYIGFDPSQLPFPFSLQR